MCYRQIHNDARFLNHVVEEVYKICEKEKIHRLIVMGTSGLVPASIIFAKYGLPYTFIRKKGESTHGPLVENDIELRHEIAKGKNTAILDDFICSGDTIRRILETIGTNPEFIILYCDARKIDRFQKIEVLHTEEYNRQVYHEIYI